MSKLFRRLSTFTFGYILLSTALVLGACNGKKPGGSEGGDTPCTTAAACSGTQICDPGTSKCVDTMACTTHDQCGTAAYCDTAAGQCVKSVAGQANPCGGDANCAGTELCAAGHCGCGGTAYTSTKVTPNMVIVQDRSGSMDGTKWEEAQAAVKDVLTNYGTQIRFGLALYPDDEIACHLNGGSLKCHEGISHWSPKAGALFVPPGDNKADTINAILKGTSTDGCSGTPIGATLAVLKDTQNLWETNRSNYILLVTDGKENCDSKPIEVAGQLLAGTPPEIPPVTTYVIGFKTGSNEGSLTAIAAAGGTTNYYPADDLDMLKAKFGIIAGSILSCTYSLGTTPPDANKLYVFQNGLPLTRDPNQKNGWDYDSGTNQVKFYGAACDALKQSAEKVEISYGCPSGSMGG